MRADKEYQKRVGMYWLPSTLFKIFTLGITGHLKSVNSKVFGTGPTTSQKKKKN